MKMPLNKTKQRIIRKAQQYNFSPAEINTILIKFKDPRLDGCLRTFNYAIHELEAIKGARELIKHAFELIVNDDLRRGKGALYELHAALKLQEKGHTILEFSKKMEIIDELKKKTVEFDIITNKNIVECKNLCFEALESDPLIGRESEKIQRLFKQCRHGTKGAAITGKPYCMVFKTPIPPEFDWLRKDLISRGAQIIDPFS